MKRAAGKDHNLESIFEVEPSLDEVVLTAAGLVDAARETYLRDIAAIDRDLAARARRRLTAAGALSDSFLAVPAVARLDGDVAESDEPPSGAALPADERYELGECLGEGGMGRVVAAFDRQLGRSVALKLLTYEDPEILRLFLHEARAQARIQHPHVLEIYDSGKLCGQPFIAMRHVAGGTLAEVGPTLSLEHRVQLLAQVAEGPHAAHREGLLHRDVKPSNVLVEQTPDGELVALVADFGLATGLDDVDVTAADAVAGSPHYIAPERLGCPSDAVDRRSDIYSLGVTMYQLLTGALPFPETNTVDLLRQVAQQDLPLPSQHAPHLPVELEAIILRCVARDPARRYASARAVAADLQRYLDGEVVEAYAAGLAYRLTRFVLRHRLLVAITGAAAAAMIVASVAVAVFAVRADAARQRAERRQEQAEELIRFMVVDLRAKLESLGRLDVLDDVGGAAADYFAAVPEAELSEGELLRRSRMLYQLGEVRIQQGDLAGAAAPMAESLTLAQRLAARRPDDIERLFELGQAQFWVGFVHWELGDLAAARAPFEAYLDISRRLAAADPDNLDWRRELSYAHSNLGSILQAEGELEGALDQFRATLEVDRALATANATSDDARSELAATHNLVGVVLRNLGRLDEAGDHLRAELEIRQSLAAAATNVRWQELLGVSHSYVGDLSFMQGDLPAAAGHFARMRQISERLVAHDPANSAWRYQLAWSLLDSGRVAFARGDLEAARISWQKERQLIDQLLAVDAAPHRWRRTQATGLLHLALLQRSRNDSAALASVRTAIEILEPIARARPTDREAHRWLSRGHLLVAQLEGSGEAAVAACRHAAETIEPLARGSRDGRVLAPWAEALSCLGRHDAARSVVETLRALGFAEPKPWESLANSSLLMSRVAVASRLNG